MKILMFFSVLPPVLFYYFFYETHELDRQLLLTLGVCAFISEILERFSRKEPGSGNLFLVVWLIRSFAWGPIAADLIINTVMQIPWQQWLQTDFTVTVASGVAAFGFIANSILLFTVDTLSAVATKLRMAQTKDIWKQIDLAAKHERRPICVGTLGLCAVFIAFAIYKM